MDESEDHPINHTDSFPYLQPPQSRSGSTIEYSGNLGIINGGASYISVNALEAALSQGA